MGRSLRARGHSGDEQGVAAGGDHDVDLGGPSHTLRLPLPPPEETNPGDPDGIFRSGKTTFGHSGSDSPAKSRPPEKNTGRRGLGSGKIPSDLTGVDTNVVTAEQASVATVPHKASRRVRDREPEVSATGEATVEDPIRNKKHFKEAITIKHRIRGKQQADKQGAKSTPTTKASPASKAGKEAGANAVGNAASPAVPTGKRPASAASSWRAVHSALATSNDSVETETVSEKPKVAAPEVTPTTSAQTAKDLLDDTATVPVAEVPIDDEGDGDLEISVEASRPEADTIADPPEDEEAADEQVDVGLQIEASPASRKQRRMLIGFLVLLGAGGVAFSILRTGGADLPEHESDPVAETAALNTAAPVPADTPAVNTGTDDEVAGDEVAADEADGEAAVEEAGDVVAVEEVAVDEAGDEAGEEVAVDEAAVDEADGDLPAADDAGDEKPIAPADAPKTKRTSTATAQPRARKAPDRALAQRLYQEGTKLFLKGHLSAAQNRFNRALSADPGFAQAHRGLGLVHERRGSRKQAISSYKRYLRLAPRASDAAAIDKRIANLGK